ncbi:hypothetical protein ACFL3G_12925, partial [Planctomycetota bacterium]
IDFHKTLSPLLRWVSWAKMTQHDIKHGLTVIIIDFHKTLSPLLRWVSWAKMTQHDIKHGLTVIIIDYIKLSLLFFAGLVDKKPSILTDTAWP